MGHRAQDLRVTLWNMINSIYSVFAYLDDKVSPFDILLLPNHIFMVWEIHAELSKYTNFTKLRDQYTVVWRIDWFNWEANADACEIVDVAEINKYGFVMYLRIFVESTSISITIYLLIHAGN